MSRLLNVDERAHSTCSGANEKIRGAKIRLKVLNSVVPSMVTIKMALVDKLFACCF